MFKRKESMLYRREELPFISIGDYIRDYVKPGDFIIPVCGDVDTAFEIPDNIHDDPCNPNDFIKDYDERLLRIYQRRDTEVVLKNVRMLNGMDPSKKGIRSKVLELSNKLEEYIGKMGKGKANVIGALLRKVYDGYFKDKSGDIPETHIWIPIWDINSENCIVLRFFGRIEVIVS